MPWTNETLPEAAKKALPEAAAGIWLKAANAALAEEKSEEAAIAAGWGAVKNAGFEKGADGKWQKAGGQMHEFEAEIFAVGTWNGDRYSLADLDDMVRNFEALRDTVKPPVKPGHTGGIGKPGQISFGWVTGLRRAGEKLIARFSQVPDIVYRAIKSGRFKRVSAEIYWNYKHAGQTLRRVLAGVAVLGADVPAVTNLADLEAYLSQHPGDPAFEKMAVFAMETETIKTKKHNIEGDAMPKTAEELQRELEKEKAARVAAENRATQHAEERAAERKQAAETGLKAFCEDQVKAGKMTPAAREVITGRMDQHVYSEAEGFTIGFDTFKAFCEKQGKVLDDGDAGSAHGQKNFDDPGREVDQRTRKYVAEHQGATYAAAMSEVLAADPELAEAYRQDISRG